MLILAIGFSIIGCGRSSSANSTERDLLNVLGSGLESLGVSRDVIDTGREVLDAIGAGREALDALGSNRGALESLGVNRETLDLLGASGLNTSEIQEILNSLGSDSEVQQALNALNNSGDPINTINEVRRLLGL